MIDQQALSFTVRLLRQLNFKWPQMDWPFVVVVEHGCAVTAASKKSCSELSILVTVMYSGQWQQLADWLTEFRINSTTGTMD